MTNSQLDTTNESQEVRPFPAGDHKAHINRHINSLNIILSNNLITKTLISLHRCVGWSAPLLFANPQRQVYSHRGSYLFQPEMAKSNEFSFHCRLMSQSTAFACWDCDVIFCCEIFPPIQPNTMRLLAIYCILVHTQSSELQQDYYSG